MKHLAISDAIFRRYLIGSASFAIALILFTVSSALAQAPIVPDLQRGASGNAMRTAQTMMDAGQFTQAEAVLRLLVASEPSSASAHSMLAYCMLRMDDPSDSLKEYTRAAAIQHPSSADLQNVAKDYALLNDLADADHWMVAAVRMDPADPEAWYGLGRIRYSQQRFQDASKCFQRALVLDPRSVKAEDNLGLSYEGLNHTEDAVAAYRNAIEWQKGSPHPSEQPLLNLGIVLLHQRKLPEAEQLLTQAASIAPNDPHIREQLGHLYLQLNQLPKAQEQFQQAIALNPRNPGLHFLLGRVYRAEGNDQKAKAEFAKSAAISGYHSTSAAN